MGTKNSKLKRINDYELNEFARQSDLTFDEIKDLHIHFKSISSLEKDDGVIDYEEFCGALKMEKSLIAERFFKIFDLNHDSVLNFREFVLGVSVLINNNLESLTKISFSIFDVEKKGEIDRDNFIEIISSCLEKVPSISIPRSTLESIVDQTFSSIQKEFKSKSTLIEEEVKQEEKLTVNSQQYAEMVKRNPNILKWLQLDLEKIKSGAELLIKNPKKFVKKQIKN
jgi:Ca2+-binding EF-hand superfamily protein